MGNKKALRVRWGERLGGERGGDDGGGGGGGGGAVAPSAAAASASAASARASGIGRYAEPGGHGDTPGYSVT